MTAGAHTVEKLAGATAALATLLPSMFTNDLTTPVIGVGLATVGGAALGTFAAIAYDEQVRPRGKLIMLAPATVIIASSAVGVIPRAMGWEWSSGGVEGGLAGLAAVGCYYLLPAILKRAGELVRSFTLADFLPWRRRDTTLTPDQDNAQQQAPPPKDPPT